MAFRIKDCEQSERENGRSCRFTFQFISDAGGGRAEIFHGGLDEVWPKVEALNDLQHQYGVFVTPNETDFRGRKAENIVRARSLFVEADGHEQVEHCESALATSGIIPSAVVRTGRGAHYYFFAEVARDAFSACQQALIDKLGTDNSIKDLPRVMRLPGSLHLKDPSQPRLVTLEPSAGPRPRYSPDALMAALGASATLIRKTLPTAAYRESGKPGPYDGFSMVINSLLRCSTQFSAGCKEAHCVGSRQT